MTTLLIQPRDPLMVRDGRPFAADPGARAFTLDWPLPATLAGAMRTMVGNAMRVNWADSVAAEEIRRIRVAGPLLTVFQDDTWWLYVPAPSDAVVFGDDAKRLVSRLAPVQMAESEGCDLPDGLSPLLMQSGPGTKPAADAPRWWRLDAWTDWAQGLVPDLNGRTMGRLPVEERVHVAIGMNGTAAEGQLFTTSGLCFDDCSQPAALTCQVRMPDVCQQEINLPGWITLGGERRISRMEPAGDPWPQMPDSLVQALTGTTRVALYLMTPGIFKKGYRPGWVGGEAPVDGLHGAQLVAAAVSRHGAVSGWDLREGKPRPVRWLAPAGSVYYLELVNPLTADQARALWLSPVADEPFHRHDGYGLALPGIWDYAK